jgi:hypothetical protein
VTVSRATRTLELRIHARGTETPTDGTVEFTIAHGRFVGVPTFGGQTVRPTEGRTENTPYWIEILDVDGDFTAALAVSGRLTMLGRILELRLATDGGAFATVDTRRCSNLQTGPEGRYQLECSDERWIEQRTLLFERTTSWQLDPPGATSAWMGRSAAGERTYRVVLVTTDHVQFAQPDGLVRVSATMVEVLRNDYLEDMTPTSGAFRELRFRTGGVDRLVNGFDLIPGVTGPAGTFGFINKDRLGPLMASAEPSWMSVWVYWPGHGLDVGDRVTGRLYWPGGIPTTAATPYLLGSRDTGLRPGDVWEEILQGLHGGPTQRYDPAAFSTLAADSYPAPWWRIQGPQVRDQWIEAQLCRPFTLVPFVDAIGRIAPRSLRPPAAIDPDTLYEFHAGTVLSGPTWRNPGGEAITAVVLKARTRLTVFDFPLPLASIAWERRVEADTIEDLGLREAIFAPTDAVFRDVDVEGVFAGLKTDTFDRFQDGPQVGELVGPVVADAPVPGDLVILNQDDLHGPNPETGARSGLRIVHVLERRRVYDAERATYVYLYLDAGPKAQPLATPTVAVAQNTATPKHRVDITVSDVPAGATAIVEVAHGSAPAAEDWITVRTDVANETIVVGNRPSGTLISVRARATAPTRVRSGWSAVDDVTTEALTPPSAVTATAFGRSVLVEATLEEPAYAVEYSLDTTPQVTLPAGSTQHTFHGLATGQQRTFGVRHRDGFGGVSTEITDTATPGAALPAPAMGPLRATATLIPPRPTDEPVVPDEEPTDDVTGVVAVLRLVAGDPAFAIQIRRSPDAGGSPGLLAAMLTGSGLGSFDADAAVDGATDATAWDTDAASSGATLTIDLGAAGARAMTDLGLYLDADTYGGFYDLQWSDNGVDWVTVLTGFPPNLAGWNRASWPAAGTHRYWRLELTNTPGSGPAITELELTDAVVVAIVPGTQRTYQDPLPADGGAYWYQAAHIRDGWETGPPTAWVRVSFVGVDEWEGEPPSIGDDDLLRIRRATIYDDGKYAPQGEADGHLASDVRIYDGPLISALARHVEESLFGRDGDSRVFGQAYQNAPVLLLAALKVRTFDDSWTGERILRVHATNVSTTGFDVVAQNVAPGVITARDDDFPTTNLLDALGEATELTLADAPANDAAYVVHYSVELRAHALEGGGRTSLTITVAIDTSESGAGGDWVERATKAYAVAQEEWFVLDPGDEVATWSHEQRTVNVSGLDSSSKVRVRIKAVTATGTGETSLAVHGFNLATDADAAAGATYTTATDSVESATPNDEDGVLFVPVEAA